MSEPPAFLTIDGFCQQHPFICRTNVYREIKEGRLKAVKFGRRTGITAEAVAAWRETYLMPVSGNGAPQAL